MNLNTLKKKGYKIVTKWQECQKKSIFVINSNDYKKFDNYKNLAFKKKCKFIICNDKFKKKINQSSIKYFFYKNQKDIDEITRIFYDLKNLCFFQYWKH